MYECIFFPLGWHLCLTMPLYVFLKQYCFPRLFVYYWFWFQGEYREKSGGLYTFEPVLLPWVVDLIYSVKRAYFPAYHISHMVNESSLHPPCLKWIEVVQKCFRHSDLVKTSLSRLCKQKNVSKMIVEWLKCLIKHFADGQQTFKFQKYAYCNFISFCTVLHCKSFNCTDSEHPNFQCTIAMLFVEPLQRL